MANKKNKINFIYNKDMDFFKNKDGTYKYYKYGSKTFKYKRALQSFGLS